MSMFLDICPTHKENYISCGPCLETASSVWLFEQDNQKLKKELRHIKTITCDLEERLTNLESNYSEIIKNSSQPDAKLPMSFIFKQSLKDYLLALQMPTNFFSLIRDHELSVSFLLQTKVIESEKKCECGKEMVLKFCEYSNEYIFTCECSKSKKLLHGSIWEDTALSQDKILLYLFLWAMNLGDKEISELLGIRNVEQTEIDEKLKKIVSEHFMRTLPKFRGIVEIDESCFRSGKGPLGFGQTTPEKWVFGLYERESKRVYMELVPKRTAAYLLPIIQKRCEAGTTIISDQWAAYNKLPELGFPHYTVDHSRFFVNPHSREIHTQHIEISWCWAKYNIKRKSRKLKNLQDSLNVFCWKRQYRNYNKITEVGDIMKALFELIKEDQQNMKMKKIPEVEVEEIIC
ncbi:unnamed protein product [Blepharisma stoltei]|uniref:ISXO2-like transposase domain-containing protein n=1 Tax=Blepharisma stoltei TaxID=1481888 RepID=A0AAU9JW34_9CILI|nr:unnamed protein product [Blepharisma stoltei]